MAEQPRAWQEPFEVRDLVLRRDERGFLFEVLRFVDDGVPAGGQVYVFSVEPGHRRGDHYHLHKQEWFTCVQGRVRVLLRAPDGARHAVELSPESPQVIYAGPGTAHALMNDGPGVAVIVSYGSRQHDHADPDTYRQLADDDVGPRP